MKTCDNFFGKHHLDITRVKPLFSLVTQVVDLCHRLGGQQLVIAPHELVGYRHDLAKYGLGCFRDADIVALGFGHFLDTIGAFQQRHSQHTLRLLAVFFLKLAPNQQVELLVGSAQFEVGLQFDRIVALQQRVQEFVNRNGHARPETLGEVVTLDHLRHRVAGRQLNEPPGTQLIAPLRVVANFCFSGSRIMLACA